jgi:hypothetical protein
MFPPPCYLHLTKQEKDLYGITSLDEKFLLSKIYYSIAIQRVLEGQYIELVNKFSIDGELPDTDEDRSMKYKIIEGGWEFIKEQMAVPGDKFIVYISFYSTWCIEVVKDFYDEYSFRALRSLY